MLGPKKNMTNSSTKNNNQSNRQQVYRAGELKIALVCQGNLIGTEDVINQRNYSTTIKCTTTSGSLYTLKTEDFHFWIGKNEKTMKMIKELSNEKDQITKKKIK